MHSLFECCVNNFFFSMTEVTKQLVAVSKEPMNAQVAKDLLFDYQAQRSDYFLRPETTKTKKVTW